jgi:hypothetical protein
MTSPAAPSREQQHSCLPRPARLCPMCGESLAIPIYCGTCGVDITPRHVCAPHPLPHVCANTSTRGTCLACGQAFPASLFCKTCGADITPLHQCTAAPATQVRRVDPLHICPALPIQKCVNCGSVMPSMVFCEHCGVEITAPHVCAPQPEAHVCSPLITMPRRCAKCGEIMPAHQHCSCCGTDITATHLCGQA